MLDDAAGQIFETEDGYFASARLPDALRLPRTLHDELEHEVIRWEAGADHIPRGDTHAARCIKFWGGGLKADQDARLAMPHSKVALSDREQLYYLQLQARIRGLLHAHVLERVGQVAFGLVDAVRDAFRGHGVCALCAASVSSLLSHPV